MGVVRATGHVEMPGSCCESTYSCDSEDPKKEIVTVSITSNEGVTGWKGVVWPCGSDKIHFERFHRRRMSIPHKN